MIIYDEELNKLSSEIWEWAKDGKPISEAPEDIKRKMEESKDLYWKLKNEELRLMGVKV